jgi:hypothetical protein
LSLSIEASAFTLSGPPSREKEFDTEVWKGLFQCYVLVIGHVQAKMTKSRAGEYKKKKKKKKKPTNNQTKKKKRRTE